MEPLIYHPESDPFPHQIIAELALDEGRGMTFRIKSDGEDIGEVDLEVVSDYEGFISGVGPGEKINNGYLRPASLAILACLREDYLGFNRFQLFDIEDQPVE